MTASMLLTIGVPSAVADPVTVEYFADGSASATLDFKNALTNESLALELPAGADVKSAELTLEGVVGYSSPSRTLDFGNGTLGTDVWAYWWADQGIYPPSVDPSRHNWAKITANETKLIEDHDNLHWLTATSDNGAPPYAWPIQLYRFRPGTTGATSITVHWNGYGHCSMNRSSPYHAEVWLYNNTAKDWNQVSKYSSMKGVDIWLNHTFDLPSDYLSSAGDIDVAVVGIHSQWAGPMLPGFDVGRVYTDYIGVTVVSRSGPQYPSDVTLTVGDVEMTTLQGDLRAPVVVGDAEGLAAAIQAAIDQHPVTPHDITIPLALTIGGPTAGRLTVRDLEVVYEPVVNMAPEYTGPETVTVDEDSDWTPVVDLEEAFDDDFNRGDLDIGIDPPSTTPVQVETRLVRGTGGNWTLEVKPTLNYYGKIDEPVTVMATDAFGLIAYAEVDVVVEQVPDRPYLDAVGELEALEDVPFSHAMGFLDVDLPDDTLTFEDDSDLFDINASTGVIDWTPDQSAVGRHQVLVTVTDSYGLDATRLVTIDVKNTNDPPVITGPSTVSAVQDEETSFRVRADDTDIPHGDVLTYSAFSDVVDLTIDPVTGWVTFTPANDAVPSFVVTLRVQDAIGTTDQTDLTVEVENVNDPPVLADPGPIEREQGDEVSIQLGVSDPDLGLDLAEPESHAFSAEGPEALHPDAGGWVNLTLTQELVGVWQVTYTVTDAGGLDDTIVVSWVIANVNDAPTITTALDPTLGAEEDEPFELRLEAEDLDGDDLEWSDDSPLFSIDPSTGLVSFTPVQADVGTHTVEVTVEDGLGGRASVTFDLVVSNVNDAPVIVTLLPRGETSFDEGVKIPFAAVATDEDGDELTYTWLDGDREFGTGSELQCGDLSPGEHTITLVVEDPSGATVEESITLTVEGSATGSMTLVAAGAALTSVAAVTTLVLFKRKGSRGDAESLDDMESDDDAESEEEEDQA